MADRYAAVSEWVWASFAALAVFYLGLATLVAVTGPGPADGLGVALLGLGFSVLTSPIVVIAANLWGRACLEKPALDSAAALLLIFAPAVAVGSGVAALLLSLPCSNKSIHLVPSNSQLAFLLVGGGGVHAAVGLLIPRFVVPRLFPGRFVRATAGSAAPAP